MVQIYATHMSMLPSLPLLLGSPQAPSLHQDPEHMHAVYLARALSSALVIYMLLPVPVPDLTPVLQSDTTQISQFGLTHIS